MNSLRLCTLAILSSGLFALAACGGKPPPPAAVPEQEADAGSDDASAVPAPPKSLFERLGKKDGITSAVNAFVATVSQDPSLKKAFSKTTGPKLDHFKAAMVDQICEASGGDCKYTGKSMKEAHKGMKITEAQWQALVEDLKAALVEVKVGETEITDLLALLAPMHDDIVEVKAKK